MGESRERDIEAAVTAEREEILAAIGDMPLRLDNTRDLETAAVVIKAVERTIRARGGK